MSSGNYAANQQGGDMATSGGVAYYPQNEQPQQQFYQVRANRDKCPNVDAN